MLDLWQKQQLILKLEKCEVIRDKDQRDLIVRQLPPDWTANLKRSDAARTDLLHIVTEVTKYANGIVTLITCVKFLERDSRAMQEVERFWEKLSSPPAETELRQPSQESVITDPDTELARELHWNRDTIVKTFVGMVKEDPKYAPWRVLALEGPKEAGLKTLVRRLEYICEQLAKRSDMEHPLLHARIKFQPWMSSAPHLVVKEIVTSLAKNADLCMAEMEGLQLQALPQLRAVYSQVRQELDRTGDKVDENWGGDIASRKPQSKTGLARDLTACLNQSGQHCAIVLLFEDFEQLDFQCRSWFLDDWLGRNIVTLEKIVVVIVGESGLSHLEGRDRFTHCRPNIPTMSRVHLLEWAQRGWGFTNITEQDVESANEDCQGNPVKYLTYLRAWAIAHRLPMPESYGKGRLG